jgi:antitoxin MazE
MHVQLAKWGNSIGLRLPRALALQIGVREGQKVNVIVEGARLIVEPVAPAWRLEDLLQGMTPEAMGEAFDWGDDRGREVVDDRGPFRPGRRRLDLDGLRPPRRP